MRAKIQVVDHPQTEMLTYEFNDLYQKFSSAGIELGKETVSRKD